MQAQVARAQSCANHNQHIKRLSCATCVLHDTTGQLSYEAWQSWNRIYISFILLAEQLSNEGGEETVVPRENPWQQASENATYFSPKIQALTQTQTHTLALVAGACHESRRANLYTTNRQDDEVITHVSYVVYWWWTWPWTCWTGSVSPASTGWTWRHPRTLTVLPPSPQCASSKICKTLQTCCLPEDTALVSAGLELFSDAVGFEKVVNECKQHGIVEEVPHTSSPSPLQTYTTSHTHVHTQVTWLHWPAFQRTLRCSWLELNCLAKRWDSSRQSVNMSSWEELRNWYMPWSSCCTSWLGSIRWASSTLPCCVNTHTQDTVQHPAVSREFGDWHCTYQCKIAR